MPTISGRPSSRFIGDVPHEITRSIDSAAPERRLNVVLISIENLSASCSGQFGRSPSLTPKLDRLAPETLAFSQLYASGNRIGCTMPSIPRRSSAVLHLALLRAVFPLLLAALIGCEGIALKEPACLAEARTGADQLKALPASARAAVSNALAGECQLPGVACGYHVDVPEQGASGGEISVRVTFVRGDEEGCLYMLGDGKAWRFTTQGELVGEDFYL